jgi:hypothetical protein
MSKRKNSEWDAFKDLTDKVLAVPRDEILRREAEYRKRAEANLNKRGPKRKLKPSASPDPAS